MRFRCVAIIALTCACGRSSLADAVIAIDNGDNDLLGEIDNPPPQPPPPDFSYLPILVSADAAIIHGGMGVSSDGSFLFGASYANPWNGTANAGTLVVNGEQFPGRAGQEELFLSRWSLDGTRQWTQAFGSAGNFYDMRHMNVLADDNALAAIILLGSLPYAGGTLATAGRQSSAFLVVDSGGVARDGRVQVASGNNSQCEDIVGNSDIFAMVGLYGGTVDLGAGNITPALTDPNVFFAVYDRTTLALRWGRPVTSTTAIFPTSSAVDDTSGTYFTGVTSQPVDLGGGAITTSTTSAFLAHYDANGNHLFSLFVHGNADTTNAMLTPLPSSTGVVTCMMAAGGITIAGNTFMGFGGHDVLVVNYDATGTPRWADLFGGTGEDGCNAITLDAGGNVYVGGNFNASVTVGNTTVSADAAGSGYIFSLDATGAPRWIRAVGGPSTVQRLAVHDSSQSVFFHGTFNATVTLDGQPFSGPTNSMYVYRWSTQGP